MSFAVVIILNLYFYVHYFIFVAIIQINNNVMIVIFKLFEKI